MDCLFCKIVAGEIPSKKVYEDENVYAFYDINPQAPVHVVVIPKAHIAACADEITPENSTVIAKLFEAVPTIAKAAGITNGYRIVNNCGEDACQSVKHIHFHVLGGKKLSENMA
ncbi:MAG: histidine triad nucleotide-binding protein [Clostridia bacterium]|nr:histidine triad nucleotide-binding protein [Clostridia bacterium]